MSEEDVREPPTAEGDVILPTSEATVANEVSMQQDEGDADSTEREQDIKTLTISPSSSSASATALENQSEQPEDANKIDAEEQAKINKSTPPPDPAAAAAAAPSEVIELWDDDDDDDSDDTDVLIHAAQHGAKRQKTSDQRPPPPPSAEASYQSRAAHMPSWMKQAALSSAAAPPQQTAPATSSTHILTDPTRLARPQPQVNQYLEPAYFDVAPGFVPTWNQMLPKKDPNREPQWKAYQLSLLNVSEFTISGLPIHAGEPPTSLKGLRASIKNIAREQGGKAYFERNGTGGKWHIPLGAYHALFAYLKSDPKCHVEGIPEVQLKIASLGRARLEKDYPSAQKLISLGVPTRLAKALAPFQRGGVDFVLEKEGRALIADEMGLGKTIQGIASMTAYHEEWPLLVLCPSSARYHWENEFCHWLGEESSTQTSPDAFEEEKKSDSGIDEAITYPEHFTKPSKPPMDPLKPSQIHVLTSGSGAVLPSHSTRVVICSYGLAPSLIKNEKIVPGLFKCAIVDESHMLKNKATQRTSTLLPILCGTSRCVLLSGTPAFARPMELWPQLAILGTEKHGWWQDESRFVRKYVKNVSTQRRAELHTMLTGTVMIRRMKNDILKSLPSKVREVAAIDVMGSEARKEMQECMTALRRGKGKLSDFAREHTSVAHSNDTAAEMSSVAKASATETESRYQSQPETPNESLVQQQLAAAEEQVKHEVNTRLLDGQRSIRHAIMTTQHQLDAASMNALIQEMEARLQREVQVYQQERLQQIRQAAASLSYANNPAPARVAPEGSDSSSRKTVLNRMYCLTGEVKIPLIVNMLKRWLEDPTKGKLCIFAHHLSVLDAIARDAGLSVAQDGTHKYIRIDGSTSPKARQEYINTFQRDPSVRIALLGITAAGVAVTLTASSTVWFAELFWTPALMVQSEDRCHRIGQQARVRCLYFVAKGTLDELLWRLIEQKFQDLGEFVEGKEKQKMVVDKTFHTVKELYDMFVRKTEVVEEEDDYDIDASECGEGTFSPLSDLDREIQHDIEELGLSEQAMVKAFEVEETETDTDVSQGDAKPSASDENQPANKIEEGRSESEAIFLSDDEEEVVGEPAKETATEDMVSFDEKESDGIDLYAPMPQTRFYTMLFSGPTYGLKLTWMRGKMVVTGSSVARKKPSVGDIIVAINRQILPITDHDQLVTWLTTALKRPPVQIVFAEAPQTTEYTKNMMLCSTLLTNSTSAAESQSVSGIDQSSCPSTGMKSGRQSPGPVDVIDLIDD